MRDLRNIVIGLLAVGVIWSWAGGQNNRAQQQRREPAAVLGGGARGPFMPFTAAVHGGGAPGQPAVNLESQLFRMNTDTGAVEAGAILMEGQRMSVFWQPVGDERR